MVKFFFYIECLLYKDSENESAFILWNNDVKNPCLSVRRSWPRSVCMEASKSIFVHILI